MGDPSAKQCHGCECECGTSIHRTPPLMGEWTRAHERARGRMHCECWFHRQKGQSIWSEMPADGIRCPFAKRRFRHVPLQAAALCILHDHTTLKKEIFWHVDTGARTRVHPGQPRNGSR